MKTERDGQGVLHARYRRRDLLGMSALVFSGAGVRAAGSYPPPFRTTQAQFTFLEPQEDVSRFKLYRRGGESRDIGSFRGKALLINFWASWCPPCRRELPILHALQAQSRTANFEIVPVSIDKDIAAATAFLARNGLGALTSFHDPAGRLASGPESAVETPFKLFGLPMSYVIDRSGANVGYLSGEADWSRPEGLAVLRHYGGP